MSNENVFESDAYAQINRAREVWVKDALVCARGLAPLSSALDLGCGGGYFSRVLEREGLSVTGLDARAVNIERCRSACTSGAFAVADLDAPGALAQALGDARFDLGFVFGLLYHLVDPVALIRELSHVIDGVCFVSTRCAQGEGVALHAYTEFDGDAHSERPISMVPTRDAYVWAFRDSGWTHLYELNTRVDHPQWDPGVTKDGLRFTFIASKTPLEHPSLRAITDQPTPSPKWERTP